MPVNLNLRLFLAEKYFQDNFMIGENKKKVLTLSYFSYFHLICSRRYTENEETMERFEQRC